MCSMPGLLNNCSVGVLLRGCCCCCASYYVQASFHSVLLLLHACAHTASRLQQRTCNTSKSSRSCTSCANCTLLCMCSSLLVSLVEPYKLIRDSRWCEHTKISEQQCNVLCWCVVYTGVTALYTICCCLSCCWLQSVQGMQTHGSSTTVCCQAFQ
jgi:hypothetical protein